MKKLVEEVSGEGLEALIGEYVVIWCVNYIYSGKLVGVNDTDVLLDDACIVYDTGSHTAKKFITSDALPGPHYVRTAAIESYGKRAW